MKKLWMLLLAGFLAVFASLAIAQSASALTFKSADCIPGPCSGAYESSDQDALAGTDVNPGGQSRITWYTDGSADVQTNIADIFSDGHGPLLLVQHCSDWGFPGFKCTTDQATFHLTTGSDTFQNMHHTYLSSTWDAIDSISLRMCNGTDSSGTPIHCEANWHGPFHP